MALFTELERQDIVDEILDSQEGTMLVLTRIDEDTGDITILPAQYVVQMVGKRSSPLVQAQNSAAVNTRETNYFFLGYNLDAEVGMWFDYDGHKGGRLTNVTTDPALGMTRLVGTIPVGGL